MNKKLAIPLLTLILSINFPLASWAETALEKINRTGVLKAGVRTDAVPFGYLDQKNALQGYSVDLIKLIHQRVEKQLNKPIKLEFKTVTLKDRFNQVKNGNVDLVCEATSITPEREQEIDFTIPYFTTGIQLLVREEDATRFDPTKTTEAELEIINENNIKIGYLSGTTTDEYFRPIYPEAKWQLISSRADGVERLQSGELDIIASDGILLLGELWQQKQEFKQFRLLPEQPLTFEDYGCILPNNSSEWGEFVNNTITSSENTQLWNQWFDSNSGQFPYQRFGATSKPEQR